MDHTHLLYALGAAFLGGVVLNVMPCVLPVLSMKVFHLIDVQARGTSAARRDGLAYTGGVLSAFLAFGLLVVTLKVAGHSLSWGMQFQNPVFVATLCTLMVALGLNGLGVFELNVGLSGRSTGSFMNGVVAAVMATPCSAPFLGVGATFALTATTPWWATLLTFLAIGAGLAFPFVLVSFVPRAARLLPRPGPWMGRFKQLMGFTLLGAAVWLYGVLLHQVTPGSALRVLAFLVATGAGLWAVDQFGGLAHSDLRRYGVRALVLGSLSFAAGLVTFERSAQARAEARSPEAPVVVDGAINWAPWRPDDVARAHRRGRPVFVDYTADWCLNCKSNEHLVLETDTVRDALSATGVLPMKADWTNEDELIGDWLRRLGRTGIPAYAIYLPDGSVDLLPEAITPGLVRDALENAARRFPAEGHAGSHGCGATPASAGARAPRSSGVPHQPGGDAEPSPAQVPPPAGAMKAAAAPTTRRAGRRLHGKIPPRAELRVRRR